ncbi:DUF4178 domain-containing protein [Candidatus Venteria ishoeyi]|uniref:DUF4178 domain-containing protein n=1 Tax=Candidatus Venteria ishoeyi TaxID=1899563 RepID=A0A1H6FHA1_9GAMM|nr:DUF4178 domain-containing protein [Candidatus Venteria ishoeyi]MDM8547386.1 DUF4178 domain-containing protein [Candidatus Venteria ishoeyi]SEH08739.1 Uncharacterised protein [Candidatus Venteria ishoeyi]
MENQFPTYNCPSCGGPLALHFRYTKLMTCPHCGSGLFLDDKVVQLRGIQSVMADYPSLLQLYQNFTYRDWKFTPVGHVRFEYAHGYWDEWWVISSNSGEEGKWVSVDEGDIAIEVPVSIHSLSLPAQLLSAPLDFSLDSAQPKQSTETIKIAQAESLQQLSVGDEISLNNRTLLVTERGTANCIGLQGELPELFNLGDHYDYLHLQGEKGYFMTLEIEKKTLYAYEGRWVDSFEVKAL